MNLATEPRLWSWVVPPEVAFNGTLYSLHCPEDPFLTAVLLRHEICVAVKVIDHRDVTSRSLWDAPNTGFTGSSTDRGMDVCVFCVTLWICRPCVGLNLCAGSSMWWLERGCSAIGERMMSLNEWCYVSRDSNFHLWDLGFSQRWLWRVLSSGI
jgi:hypothetical protein